ncbi:MAG TPA: hypothetical protein DEB06_05060 [Phycisphaerales bacterium]|nr:hypothetical protein [Phycisphaerales bacterium]
MIIAADRARVEPWTGALALASGRPVHAVLPTHAVVLGLGLQNEERCQVLERLASGALVAHRLRWGRFTEVGVSPSDTDASAGRRLVLDSEDRALGEVVGPEALALGAALAPLVAPSAYWPLSGPRPRAPRRWLSPLAAGLIVAALLWSAAAIAESRYERAAGALLAESESLTAPLEDAQRAKSDALRLAALLRKGVAQPAADWRRVLPDLAAAQSVIPEDGFLYRLEYDGRALGLTGEAKRASDVLTRLEATPEFDGARTLGASSIVEERSTEQFSIRADRAGAPPARAATGPGGAR